MFCIRIGIHASMLVQQKNWTSRGCFACIRRKIKVLLMRKILLSMVCLIRSCNGSAIKQSRLAIDAVALANAARGIATAMTSVFGILWPLANPLLELEMTLRAAAESSFIRRLRLHRIVEMDHRTKLRAYSTSVWLQRKISRGTFNPNSGASQFIKGRSSIQLYVMRCWLSATLIANGSRTQLPLYLLQHLRSTEKPFAFKYRECL